MYEQSLAKLLVDQQLSVQAQLAFSSDAGDAALQGDGEELVTINGETMSKDDAAAIKAALEADALHDPRAAAQDDGVWESV